MATAAVAVAALVRFFALIRADQRSLEVWNAARQLVAEGGAALCAGGAAYVSSFYLSQLPFPVLIAATVAAGGLLATLTVACLRIRRMGLIYFLPGSLQTLLLDTTPVDWLTDPSFSKKLKHWLPFFMGLRPHEVQRVMRRMPGDTRTRLLRRGLVHEMPATLRRVLLPATPTLPVPMPEEAGPAGGGKGNGAAADRDERPLRNLGRSSSAQYFARVAASQTMDHGVVSLRGMRAGEASRLLSHTGPGKGQDSRLSDRPRRAAATPLARPARLHFGVDLSTVEEDAPPSESDTDEEEEEELTRRWRQSLTLEGDQSAPAGRARAGSGVGMLVTAAREREEEEGVDLVGAIVRRRVRRAVRRAMTALAPPQARPLALWSSLAFAAQLALSRRNRALAGSALRTAALSTSLGAAVVAFASLLYQLRLSARLQRRAAERMRRQPRTPGARVPPDLLAREEAAKAARSPAIALGLVLRSVFAGTKTARRTSLWILVVTLALVLARK